MAAAKKKEDDIRVKVISVEPDGERSVAIHAYRPEAKAAMTVEDLQVTVSIHTDAEYETISALVGRAKTHIAERQAYWADTKEAAFKAHKSIVALEKKDTLAFETFVATATSAMKKFYFAKEAEAKKQRADISRLAEQAQTDLTIQAAELKRAGRMSEARELLQTASLVVADVSVAPSIPTVEGQSNKRPWVAVVEDKMALIKAIAAGTVPLTVKYDGEEYDILEVNQSLLNKLAKQSEASFNMPGVRSVQDVQFSHKRGYEK